MRKMTIAIMLALCTIWVGNAKPRYDCNNVKKVPDQIAKFIKNRYPNYLIPQLSQFRLRRECIVDTALIKSHRELNPSCIEVDMDMDGRNEYAVLVIYDDTLSNLNMNVIMLRDKNGKIQEIGRSGLLLGYHNEQPLGEISLDIRIGYIDTCTFKKYKHTSESDTTYELRRVPKRGFLVYGDCGSNAFYLQNDSLKDERFTDCY